MVRDECFWTLEDNLRLAAEQLEEAKLLQIQAALDEATAEG